MPNKTVIHLLRHGLVYNPKKIIYGRLPGYHLAKIGFQMAENIANLSAKKNNDLHNVTKIYSSPLLRAIQTATPISKQLNIRIYKDNRLTESDSYFAGKKVTFHTLSQAAVKNYLKDPALPSWGEPHRWVQNRIVDIVNETVKKRAGKSTLLVSHQLPIWLGRLYYEHRKVGFFNSTIRQCTVGSLTSLYFNDDGSFNHVNYIEQPKYLLKK
jgi:broad specificity phosphatase PhoE